MEIKPINSYNKAKTHVIQLSDDTITANSRFFRNLSEIPKMAITMGMKTIMKSKKIILMAWGLEKKETVLKNISGQINTEVPASLLQLHRNMVLLVGENIYFSSKKRKRKLKIMNQIIKEYH